MKFTNNKDVIPGLAAEKIQFKIDYDKRQEEKSRVSEDTMERINIHNEIKRLLEYGLDKKETLQRLTEKFPESKYNLYFENWIEDQYKKVQKKQEKELKKDEQDR